MAGSAGEPSSPSRKPLRPFDPEAAYKVARTATLALRAQALSYAASGVRDDAPLRQKRFLEATATAEGYNRAAVLSIVAHIAEGSSPEIARTLRQQLRETLVAQNDFYGESTQIARVLLPDVPELCQRITEMSMQGRRRINPGHASDYSMLRLELRTLALLNPARALQIAGELKQKDALFQMKKDIALILLNAAAETARASGSGLIPLQNLAHGPNELEPAYTRQCMPPVN
jgi:hypothetical protein